MKIGFIVNRSTVMAHSWTTIRLAIAALRLGHTVGLIDKADLSVQSDGVIQARAHWFDTDQITAEQMTLAMAMRKNKRRNLNLFEFDSLFLRVKPLVPGLLAIALLAKEHGIPVVNDPLALMRTSSKIWLSTRTDVSTPQTLITSSQASAEMFFQRHKHGVVLKPNVGSGGRNVSLVPSGEFALFHNTFRSLLRHEHSQIIIQANIGTHEQREKRLLWLDGTLIGGYYRRRAPNEFRHNLNQGAEPEPLTLSANDRSLVAPLSVHLLNAGIRFAGLDILGAHILEVNVLNPGGVFHTDRLNETCLAQTILQNLISSEC